MNIGLKIILELKIDLISSGEIPYADSLNSNNAASISNDFSSFA